MNSFVLMAPAGVILIGALVLMFMSMYPKFETKIYIVVTSVFLVISAAFLLYYFGDLYSNRISGALFNNMLIFDSYSNLFCLLLVVGTLLMLLVGESYLNNRASFKGEFFSILLFALFGMMMLTMANELLTAFLALEIASFSIYIMVGFDSNDGMRVEAMFKYLVLGSLVGTFFLLGTALIYGATGSTNLTLLAKYIQNPQSDLTLIYIGLSMLLFTFFFKIAAFPFQSWVLDVYRASPILITAYMASVFKVAIFAFFLRAYIQDFSILQEYWHPILKALVILTLAVGTWLALTQYVVKRMLAASSIVHTGYLLLAFISLNNNNESAYVVILYLIAYLLTALGAFGLVSHVIVTTKDRVTYDDFKGLAYERPYLAAIMTVFLLSLAGIPGTIGFMGKFYVFVEAIKTGYTGLTILAILATVASLYYYFKLIAMMYFYPSTSQNTNYDDNRVSTYAIGVLGVLIIWGGIGSAIFFVEIPNLDDLMRISEIALQSLFIL